MHTIAQPINLTVPRMRSSPRPAGVDHSSRAARAMIHGNTIQFAKNLQLRKEEILNIMWFSGLYHYELFVGSSAECDNQRWSGCSRGPSGGSPANSCLSGCKLLLYSYRSMENGRNTLWSPPKNRSDILITSIHFHKLKEWQKILFAWICHQAKEGHWYSIQRSKSDPVGGRELEGVTGGWG